MINGDKGLDNLIVWKKSVDLVQMIYKEIISTFPIDERWSLSQQLRRSSISIPANIAEGYGRFHYQDNVRFCYIARGSLEETYSHIRVAIRLGYTSLENASNVIKAIDELKKILNGYIQFIKKSKQGEIVPDVDQKLHVKEEQIDYRVLLIKMNLMNNNHRMVIENKYRSYPILLITDDYSLINQSTN